MRTTIKNRIAILMACMLVATCLPAIAWAAGNTGNTGLYAGAADTQISGQATKSKQAKKSKKAKVAFTKQTVKMKVPTAYTKVVADGDYRIAFALDTRKALSLSGNRVVIKTQKTSKVQEWRFTFSKAEQAYHITNVATGKALALEGSANAGVHLVQAAPDSGSVNQRWYVISSANGYKLAPAGNINLRAHVNKKGSVVTRNTSSSLRQNFWILGVRGKGYLKSGTYTLSTSSNKLLSVPRMAIGSGAKLKVMKNASNLGQVFDITYLSNGYYAIRNVNSGMVLAASGKLIVQQPYQSQPNQKWKAKLLSNGKVKFINMKTKRALDYIGNVARNLKNTSSRASQGWTISPSAPGINSVGKRALWKANTRLSRTIYCCMVDLTMHELFVFQKVYPQYTGGPWKMIRTNRVSSGAHGSWTYARDSEISSHRYNHPEYNCFYWSSIGGGSFFHSVLYASRSYPNRITDGRLGVYISHGCIRMPLEDAKWIYDNCAPGTAVSRYY